MSKIRDITKFLSLTAAENPTNQPLASTGAALDSAEALALITGGNAITVTSGVVNHNDTSSQASVNNSGSNFIQDITLDTYGHATAITSAEAAGGDANVSVQAANPYSVVIGASADNSNVSTQGQSSVHIGYQAGYDPSDQHAYAVVIGNRAGAQAGPSYESVLIGNNAGNYLNRGQTGGQYSPGGNVAIGKYTLANSSTDRYNVWNNVAIGTNAGKSLYHSCFDNVIIGADTMSANGGASGTRRMTYGNYNTVIGSTAGYSLAYSSSDNVLIGRGAGYALGAGAVMASSNVVIGSGAMDLSQEAEGSVVIGKDAGTNISTGDYNVCLGYVANVLGNTSTGEVVVGSYLTGKGSNTFFTKGPAYNSANSSTWSTTSDERVKTNITDYTLGLDALGQVNVKTFNYRSDSDIATNSPELADSNGLVHEGLDTEKTEVGIIAQELELILPNTITTRDNGMKSVNKDELFWVMLNSIKELKARVEALENA
jgi:trimeric autotransporter adhesin